MCVRHIILPCVRCARCTNAMDWILFHQVCLIRITHSGKFELTGHTRVTGTNCTVSSLRRVRSLARAKAKVRVLRKCQTRALLQHLPLLPLAKLSRRPKPKVCPINRIEFKRRKCYTPFHLLATSPNICQGIRMFFCNKFSFCHSQTDTLASLCRLCIL